MNDERLRRRRRRRRRPDRPPAETQRDASSRPERDASGQVRERRSLPAWQWITLPVGTAFCAGIVLMGLVTNGPVAGLVVFFAGVFGLAFAAAHILVRLWLARRG
jgi:hypothetical protein